MNKNKKKVTHSQKEEQQANKVIKIIMVSFAILALGLLIGLSFFS